MILGSHRKYAIRRKKALLKLWFPIHHDTELPQSLCNLARWIYLPLVKPAVVYPVNNKMKLFKEEQFGPIIPVGSFNNLQNPID